MVVAPIAAGREPACAKLLARMNAGPAWPTRPTRCCRSAASTRCTSRASLMLDDATMADLEAFGLPRPRVPIYLAFMGDCDGPGAGAAGRARAARAATACAASSRTARASIRATTCSTGCIAHDRPVAAPYVNWIGRTVQQIREESALQRALSARVPRGRGRRGRRSASAAAPTAGLRARRAGCRAPGADAAGADAARLADPQPASCRSACRLLGLLAAAVC